jgi:rhamnogalacturonan endolyase
MINNSSFFNQLSNEIKSWPYNFIQSKDFIPPNQRGTLSGRLQVQDGYVLTNFASIK